MIGNNSLSFENRPNRNLTGCRLVWVEPSAVVLGASRGRLEEPHAGLCVGRLFEGRARGGRNWPTTRNRRVRNIAGEGLGVGTGPRPISVEPGYRCAWRGW